MSDLQPGRYTITNVAHKSYVGRALAEDLSLMPKRIVGLPQGVDPWQPVSCSHTRKLHGIRLTLLLQWTVEKLPNGNFKLAAHDKEAYTTVIDNKVFALLLPEPPSMEWKITKTEKDGKYM